MSYATRTAMAGLWHEKWINLLCSFTIGAGLVIISLASLVVYNTHITIQRIPDRFSVMVFLNDEGAEDSAKLIATIKGLKGVKTARYISKQDALDELKAAVENTDIDIEEMKDNPLPASIDLKINKSALSESKVKALAQRIGNLKGVDDVYYASGLLRVIQSIRLYANGAGLTFTGILTIAVLFVSYSTVKILLYRKQDEIDTLKYLGATKNFIRAPFLIEGALIGLSAGLAALGVLTLIQLVIVNKLGGQLPIIKTLAFPLLIFPALPLAGLIVGITGAWLAVGRIRF